MKFRLLIAGVVLSALLIGGYFIDQARSATQNVLSGFFENQPTQTSSRIGGRVARILIKEGDVVKTGQPLAEFEVVSFAHSVQADVQAEAQAKAQFSETEKGPRPEDIAKQAAAVQEAEWDYRKLIDGPLPEEIRVAHDKAKQSAALYQKARAGSRPEEIAAARATDRLAEAKLREAENGLTAEERGQLQARLNEAVSDETLKRREMERNRQLYDGDAISADTFDVARANFQQATGRRRDAEEALRRAQDGTRPEEIAQAREAYRQAHAQLQLTLAGTRKEDIEAARQDMLGADENLKLLLRGSRSEDILAARARVDQARQALLELQRGNRQEDVEKAKAAQRQAAQQAHSAEANLRERTVVSPIDGQVDRVLVADGDLVTANSPVIQLSDPNDIWLRVYLPESQLSKVNVGDEATLAIDGIKEPVIARVESIATKGEFTPVNLQAQEERGLQVFAIRLRLPSKDPRVKAGMYASVKRVGQWP